MVAQVPSTYQDSTWLGGLSTYNTTEGNDFWLTFLNNGMFDPTKAENKNTPFEMTILITAQDTTHVRIAIGTDVLENDIEILKGETKVYTINREKASTAYLLTSEQAGYKGVHVYTAPGYKDNLFSCFSYCRIGNNAASFRDATTILPTRALKNEYIIQNSPQDLYSSQLAIIATENGTVVNVTPSDVTFNGAEAGTSIPINLNQGDAYLIASHPHQDGDQSYVSDLSGSKICANKPIAVFNGNQQTSVPIDPLKMRGYSVEQSLPITQWGKEFYVTSLQHTKLSYFRITALNDNTEVTMTTEKSNVKNTFKLNAGESSVISKYKVGQNANEFVLKSNEPITCYVYTSSANENLEEVELEGGSTMSVNYGNPASAMMPSWTHRTKEIHFYTNKLDPTEVEEGEITPQYFYAYVVTKASDISKFMLDSVAVPSSQFKKFTADASMAYAHLPLGDTTQYHFLSTTGEGFVGTVYALSHAQAYYYTLGYNPLPFQDSLFITGGSTRWYQRQRNEWMAGHKHHETTAVCDSTTVHWTLETPGERPVDYIEWSLFDIVGDSLLAGYPDTVQNTGTNSYSTQHEFILPEETEDERRHFFDYRLEVYLHRAQLLCPEDTIVDTLRAVTRVTRYFNDTIRRAICMGDTLPFFYDSLYSQKDLTKYKAGVKDSTLFIATKASQTTEDWRWHVGVGKHSFTRKYQSTFGCDSIVTLDLFVCDTFRFVDTIHLCSNQDTLYHDHLYYGVDFQGSIRDYERTRVWQDTLVDILRFKTDSCQCQLSAWADQHYLGKDKQPFTGCDSIYELHLFMHKSYDLVVLDTLDYNEFPDSVYHWQIERDGKTVDFPISRKTKGMVWNPTLQAWYGIFGDTLRTKTCNECNGGNPKGCDSINTLKLLIPPAYHFEEDITWCRIHYDWNKHDTTFRDFQWYGHHSDIVYTHGGDYYDSCVSRYGVDSIYHLHLEYSQAEQPVYDVVQETVCFDSINRHFTWTSHDRVVQVDTIRQDTVGMFYYVDETRCDSIYVLELRVLPSYFIVDSVMISEEQTYEWQVGDTTVYGGTKTSLPHDTTVLVGWTRDTLHFQTQAVNGITCDSIRVLVLRVGQVYRDTTHAYVCADGTQYLWYGIDHEGQDSLRLTITDLPESETSRIYTDPYRTVLGYDSVFYLDLYRAPVYQLTDSLRVCQVPGGTFTWPQHEGHSLYDAQGQAVESIPITRVGYYEYIDSLTTETYGCDSVWTLRLFVDSVYHFNYEATTCQFDTYVWPDQDADSLDRPITTLHTGDYTYQALYHTIYGCDSIWTLTLHIDTVYTTPVSVTEYVMCDKDSLFFIDHYVYGSLAPTKPQDEPGISVPDGERFTKVSLTGIIPSSLGCDSTIQWDLTVFKTYSDTTRLRLCQPSEGRDSLFSWTNHQKVWDVHNGRIISADSIPRFVQGDTTYMYIDSLRTSYCTQCDEGRGGCDSIFVLYLTIDSTYHFYDTAHICENEYYEWQGIRFIGDSLPIADRLRTDSVLTPNTYHMRMRYDADQTCDSIYYLELYVHPIYDTHLNYTFCDNDESQAAHLFTFTDTHGTTFRDSVPFAPHAPVPESDTAYTHYDPIYVKLAHMLKTVDGCDSMVTAHITILPTYHFVARGKSCAGDTVEWRGRKYTNQGVYYDRHNTLAGCDSIFELDYYVKPFKVVNMRDVACDNEIYYHRDTLGQTIFEEEIWRPGAPRPEFITLTYRDADGCDSIIFNYYLTYGQTHYHETHATICAGKPFEYTFDDGITHVWESTAYEFEPGDYIPPYDTVFIDSLKTVLGCDSVFHLNAHVQPSYRHVDYDTICENDTYTYRAHTFLPEAAGDTILRDSLHTVNGCDSIYELRLFVHPKYYFEHFDTICADESYEWQGMTLDSITPTGDRLFVNHLYTIHGCDSIYHLYLTVKDTTFEVRYDSVCVGDTLVQPETGHLYTEAGDYKDTILNEAGCHHFIYTHSTIIPPTVPTIWADKPMCHGESAFNLYYTYTSHKPISYSLYFDSVGLSMGFENMIDVPIHHYADTMVISVPIPYKDNDPTQFPEPNYYSIHLELDNGICLHKESDCIHDSTFVMNYPQWLLVQRFGDVIALLNEDANGGHTWTQYQWYKGDSLLVGENKPYLYVPTGLIPGEQYYVRLMRDGEEEDFPTCPVTVSFEPSPDSYAPTMGYLSVVPTCVITANPYIHILSRKGGTYRISTAEGRAFKSGAFHADATQVEVPTTAGMYIVQLWSEDTPEEPYRAIKIVVKEQCETCATSF